MEIYGVRDAGWGIFTEDITFYCKLKLRTFIFASEKRQQALHSSLAVGALFQLWVSLMFNLRQLGSPHFHALGLCHSNPVFACCRASKPSWQLGTKMSAPRSYSDSMERATWDRRMLDQTFLIVEASPGIIKAKFLGKHLSSI